MEEESDDSDHFEEQQERGQAAATRRRGDASHGTGNGRDGARRERDMNGEGSFKGTSGRKGLPNLGNTCYLNATVQALAHTKPFAEFFVECSDFVPPRTGERARERDTTEWTMTTRTRARANTHKLECIERASHLNTRYVWADGPTARSASQRRLVHSFADVINEIWESGSKTASPHNFVRDVLDLNPDYRSLGQQVLISFSLSLSLSLSLTHTHTSRRTLKSFCAAR
jgi:hypothetical protein